MIASLSGRLQAKSAEAAIVDVGGIGFQVLISARTAAALPDLGEAVAFSTYLQVSEAGVALFGFAGPEEKAVFESLIVVHGIGPKAALAALSALEPTEIVSAIMNEDVSALQRIPGVGKKTASRIIVELKGSLADALSPWPELFEGEGSVSAVSTPQPSGEARESATAALRSMGFTDAELSLALSGAPADADDVALIQYALKRLGNG